MMARQITKTDKFEKILIEVSTKSALQDYLKASTQPILFSDRNSHRHQCTLCSSRRHHSMHVSLMMCNHAECTNDRACYKLSVCEQQQQQQRYVLAQSDNHLRDNIEAQSSGLIKKSNKLDLPGLTPPIKGKASPCFKSNLSFGAKTVNFKSHLRRKTNYARVLT